MSGINAERPNRGGWLPTLHSFCKSTLFMDSRDSRVGAGAIAVGRRDREGAEVLSDGNRSSSVCSIVPPAGRTNHGRLCSTRSSRDLAPPPVRLCRLLCLHQCLKGKHDDKREVSLEMTVTWSLNDVAQHNSQTSVSFGTLVVQI